MEEFGYLFDNYGNPLMFLVTDKARKKLKPFDDGGVNFTVSKRLELDQLVWEGIMKIFGNIPGFDSVDLRDADDEIMVPFLINFKDKCVDLEDRDGILSACLCAFNVATRPQIFDVNMANRFPTEVSLDTVELALSKCAPNNYKRELKKKDEAKERMDVDDDDSD